MLKIDQDINKLLELKTQVKEKKAELKRSNLNLEVDSLEKEIKLIEEAIIQDNPEINLTSDFPASTETHTFVLKFLVKDKSIYHYETFIQYLKDKGADTSRFEKVVPNEEAIKTFIEDNIKEKPALADFKEPLLSKTLNINEIKLKK